MSRHALSPRNDHGPVTGGFIGWDRPLQTFSVQVFKSTDEGEEEPHIWFGTYPGELTSAAAAIKIIVADCIVPADLGAVIEMERLASLGAIGGSPQVDLKGQFLRHPPSDAGE